MKALILNGEQGERVKISTVQSLRNGIHCTHTPTKMPNTKIMIAKSIRWRTVI